MKSNKSKNGSKKSKVKEKGLSISQSQIKRSLERLEKLKQEGLERISSVSVENGYVENERKIKQEVLLEKLVKKMKLEEKRSGTKNAAIAMRWPSVVRQNVPGKIQKELHEQEKACSKILESKQLLVEEFKKILKEKDIEYVETLRKQSNEIEFITKTMIDQISKLRLESEQELQLIEDSFENERKELINEKEHIVKEFHDKRKEKEVEIIDSRIKEVEENELKLKELIENVMEKFARTKKEKDERLHELEVSIDNMRGIFELNAEKLKYYHQVLFERVKENKQTIRSNKNKLTQLQDQLTNIKAKYLKDDKKFNQKNHELTEQYAKMVKQYKDLLTKFKYFEKCDTAKYNQIWKMNEKEITKLANKLITADKYICENILKINWKPPHEVEDSYEEDIPISGGGGRSLKSSSGCESNNNKAPIIHLRRMSIKPDMQNIKKSDPCQEKIKKKILSHFCDNSGFLVEEKVKRVLEKLHKNEEKDLLKLDSVFRSLGISDPSDIQNMLQILYSKVDHVDDLQDPTKNWKAILNYKLPPKVIIESLSEFVIKKRTSSKDKSKKKTKLLNLKQIEKQRKEKEEMDHWKRFENIIPKRKYKLWQTLQNTQEKYYQMLKKRKNMSDEISRISKENNELENILKEYMKHKINQELYIKPNV